MRIFNFIKLRNVRIEQRISITKKSTSFSTQSSGESTETCSYLQTELDGVASVNHVVDDDDVTTMDRAGQMANGFVSSARTILVQMSGRRLGLVAAAADLVEANISDRMEAVVVRMGRGWDGMIGLGMVVQVQLVEILQMSFD